MLLCWSLDCSYQGTKLTLNRICCSGSLSLCALQRYLRFTFKTCGIYRNLYILSHNVVLWVQNHNTIVMIMTSLHFVSLNWRRLFGCLFWLSVVLRFVLNIISTSLTGVIVKFAVIDIFYYVLKSFAWKSILLRFLWFSDP